MSFWCFSVSILDISTGVPGINAEVKYISELHIRKVKPLLPQDEHTVNINASLGIKH